ncbi:hypothetical protein [Microvirga terricola]|uniref:Uncharacterized protein n=1 Tax=Microvirga terricola TaxID=2719797 RepID=A0ABX0VD96_9HYPH|nr:hypothetical protein [Microvirga terricola]NIX77813.1 hypothetical protein [Microvirga terricola]
MRRFVKICAAIAAVGVVVVAAGDEGLAQTTQPNAVASGTRVADAGRRARLVVELETKHPAEYYLRAKSLFESGQKDDAVFLLYLGQLRYRLYLTANPNLPKDRDPAVFSALSETVGRPINEYAFGDIPALARTIQAVLALDEARPDEFTSQTATPKQRREIREGLAEMRSTLLAQADAISAQRAKNGLPNRN